MAKDFIKLAKAIVLALLSSSIIFSCGPEEQPGGGGGSQGGGSSKTVSVTGVSLNKTSLSLEEGGTETLTATVAPSDATNKAVSWKSSDSGVATVDSNGKVTAVKAGSTTITITTTDGSKTATCSVTVTAKTPATVAVTGVSLNKSSLSLEEEGSETLTAKVAPDNATNKTVSWKSSDSGVATVDESGKVTAVKIGSATITVTTKDGSKTATCKVTVTAKTIPLSSIEVSPKDAKILEGETLNLSVKYAPDNASDKSVTWSSSNTNVAVVDDKGVVTGVSEGNVDITAKTKNGLTSSCKVSVNKDASLKGIAFMDELVEVTLGIPETLYLVFTPEYAKNKNVTWKSSNTAVAKVSSEGEVEGVKEGEVTITATSEEGGFKATCKVKVTSAAKAGVYWVQGNRDLYFNGQYLDDDQRYNPSIDLEGNLYYCTTYNTYYGSKWYVYWNGVPLYEFDFAGKGFETAAGGGYYFIPDANSDNTYFRVWKVNPKAESAKEYSVFDGGQAHSFWINDAAADSKGNLYIVGRSKDSSGKVYATLWKLDTKNKVTKSNLTSGFSDSSPEIEAVAVNKNGDVFCLLWDGTYSDSGNFNIYLFKNGVRQYLVTSECCRQYSRSCDIAVLGSDVYILVNEYTGSRSSSGVRITKNQVYKNRNALYNLKQGESVYALDIAVTSKGDVYCSGFQGIVSSKNFIWKNGKVLYNPSESISARSLVVKE